MSAKGIIPVAAAFVLLCIPIAGWGFAKPFRVLAPSLAGLSCVTDAICTDAPSRGPEAKRLYDDALEFVGMTIAPVESPPRRVVFCQSEDCADAFGLGRSTANTLPFGIVYGPRAWKPHYVRHELIHHLQIEQLGFDPFHRRPAWFTEGMAYSLSGDPRAPLTEPFERYRSDFDAWLRSVGPKYLWDEAKKL